MKKVVIFIVALLMIYITFVSIEVIRFNNTLGTKPLIMLKEEKIDITKEKGIVNKDYVGLGYTISYDYNIEYSEKNDNAKIIILKGSFKLFNKIRLSAWIQ